MVRKQFRERHFLGKRRSESTESPANSSVNSANGFETRLDAKLAANHAPDGRLKSSNGATAAAPAAESTQPPDPQIDPASRPAPLQRRWLWSLVWLAILGVFSGMGAAALLWLASLPPPVNCRQTEPLTVDMDRLYCAEEAARSGELSKLVAGVDMLKDWSPEHPLYAEAQRLINKWSEQILLIAREKVKQSDLKGALGAIQHIPKTSPVYQDAQQAVTRWQEIWRRGEAINAKAQAALKQQQWDQASEQMAIMAEMEHEYWSFRRANALAEQIGAEKRAWQGLTEARRTAAAGTPDQLAAAIAVVQRLPQTSYAMEAAKANLKQWSRSLLATAIQKWQQGDTAGAAAVLRLPSSVAPTPEVKDVLQFEGAYRMMSAVNSRWIPTVNQIWSLMEAIAAMQQVSPESAVYAQAQAHLKNWQAQLQDSVQLKYASLTAELGPRSAYQLAIGQASQVQASRPRYTQAQTLMAHWADQIERIEDRPYLLQAQALAKSGQVADLRQAIAAAGKIVLGRALRGEAQDLIATWRGRIETIEDQPFLNTAWALAEQGKLQEAIMAAGNINPGRALYGRAQAAIADWRAEQIRLTQLAQDRPILDRAYALADEGDLTAAIDSAAQIAAGRVLYDEAQGAIARWKSQREAILNPPLPSDADPLAGPDWVDPSLPPPIPDGSVQDGKIVNPATLPGFNSGTGLPPRVDLVPPAASPELPPVIIPSPELPPAPEAEGPPPIPSPVPATPRYPFEGYYDERYYRNNSN